MIEKTKISRLISNVLLPGGQALIARGEFAEAQAWIERGLRLAEENGTPSPLLICTGYYLLAWVDKEIGEWDRAIERCKVSVEIAEKHQLWMRYIEFLVRQGELLAYQGDFVNAEQIIKQAISCADEHKLPDSAKFCYRYLSEVYYRQGLFNQAVEASKLGEPKFAQYNSNIAMYHLREAECYALSAFVGESCDGLATPQELIARAAQALKYLSGREMAEYLPVAYRINGFLAWVEEDNTGEALRCFSTGLKIARATNNLPETARLLVWRNRLRLLTNPTANSRAELIKAAELFERLKALPELNQVNQLLVGYYQSKKPPVPLGTDTPPHWTLST
jgi:tetratricopeptide (TPR) repeat protein